MSQLAKGKFKARDPPPTLFLHPSPSASHVSLPGIVPSTSQPSQPVPAPPVASGAPLGHTRTGSLLRGSGGDSIISPVDAPNTRRTGGTTRNAAAAPNVAANVAAATAAAAAAAAPGVGGGGLGGALNLPIQLNRGESTRATDRTDALWAEMQATLEEVELSASGATRVFGPDHEAKLAELRMAQIALAQAWARSEADDAIETVGTTGGGLSELRNLRSSVSEAAAPGADGGAGRRSTEAGTTTGAAGAGAGAGATTDGGGNKSTAGTGSVPRPGSSSGGQERLGAKLEEETEVDILLARKRREANDRYFQRVNQGVLDVVAKLEEVAIAMRAVEQESKDIWGDGDASEAGGNGNESVTGT
ncbi:hypothetical protein QBC46DRAFT_377424 [Diplogelasinospora grovesii]|uniref:Uncharacterized protein n=1 Tax=Diplogelasinospora grovesii TaxID=303347 RepID=A0AAN6ND44_9PEZI|nr:hypothetical protein QBC46DRAFT_377424 [Diplogelasinospora grovesii]